MACSNCNTPSCGCSGTYVVSQTCPPACSEVFNSSCIVYTGVDITCVDPVSGLSSTIISRNDYLDTALTALVNYICARFNPATIPSSVVVSGDSFIVVSPNTVGYVTTYTITLDPTSLPSASIVTGGANAVVTGTGAALDPYVVNANESVVAVDPASALTLVVDPSTPGPYETTYTIGIDSSLLPVTELQTSFGHISITEIPNTPNAGDTTYTLEVDEVTLTSIDPKLDVVLTNAGGIAPFERTFTVDVNDTLMGEFIMDTAGANIVAAGGITVAYDAIAHQITIGETIGVPDQWKIISDGVTDITAGSPTDKLRVVAGTGTSVGLASGPGANEATFTITNTDLGSDQLIFGSVDCNNGGPSVGTCSAATNTDALTLVGGAEIDLSVVGNTITIDNLITKVYSNVVGDDAVSLQANSTTDTLDILGGDRISTSGTAAPGGNELTVTFDGVAIGAGLTGSGTTADPLVADGVTLSSAGGTNTLVNDGVGPTLATKGINAGSNISITAAPTEITIAAKGSQVQVTQDINVTGSAFVTPFGGNVDVSADISSLYMQTTLVDNSTGKVVAIGASTVDVIQNVGAGLLTLGVTAANFQGTLIITGDAV